MDILTDELKNGNVGALEQVYRMHAPQIFSLVEKLVKNHQDVEEVVQDVFCELWQKRESIGVAADYKGLLFTIARRRAIDRFRKQVNERFLEIFDTEIADGHDIEDSVHYSEVHCFMEQHIEQLPPKRKLIFTLRKDQGLTNKQIAEKLGISTTMVERQMKLAYKTLRAHFQYYSEPLCIALIIVSQIF